MIFGGEVGLRKVGLSGIHPLTRRYVLRIKMKQSVFMSLVFLTGCAASQAAPIEVLSYEVDDNHYTLIAISEKNLTSAYFGAFRSVISGLSDHPFRFKPITD
ncbi:hypothetical protein P7M63_21600, partial [Vibrio parahaemolyticus]|nr:hypothetical protein [Vibrio parahaemolyticus]